MRIMSDVPVGAKPTCSFVKSRGFSEDRCSSCCQRVLFMNRNHGHTAVCLTRTTGSATPSSSSRNNQGFSSAAFYKMVKNSIYLIYLCLHVQKVLIAAEHLCEKYQKKYHTFTPQLVENKVIFTGKQYSTFKIIVDQFYCNCLNLSQIVRD